MKIRNANMSCDDKCYACNFEYTVFRPCPNGCKTPLLSDEFCETCWETGIQTWCPRCGMNVYEAQAQHSNQQCDEFERKRREGEEWKNEEPESDGCPF